MFYEVIPIRLFREDGAVLTYSSDEIFAPGTIVEIPLGRSKTFGIISRKVSSVNFPTKPITKTLYDIPLPTHILKSISWLSSYYLTPLPLAAKLFLPQGLGKKRRSKKSTSKSVISNGPGERVIEQSGDPSASKSVISNGLDGVTVAGSPEAENELARSRTHGEASRQDPRHPLGLSRLALVEPVCAPKEPTCAPSQIALNPAQKHALRALETVSTPTKLLHGVTGSGKTNIYLKMASKCLKTGKSVILLVPEIALTSQLVQIFEQTFGQNITLIHSKQTEAERHIIWENILKTTSPQIIIGPRSALLSPIKNLGLIIIDEAHESTYFQENTPKYSALRLASFMAKTAKITCIFGTATPLVTDYYLAKSKNSLVSLSQKAKKSAKTPDFHIISLRDSSEFTTSRYFSNQLLHAIETNLKNHHQTLIFHNRRGSAPLTICEDCGWQALCPHCFLPLTLHSDTYSLICHTCGFSQKVPSSCPECHHPGIIHKGFGTKLLETELKKLYKNAKIIRFDADNTKEDTLDAKFSEVKSGNYDIIIGTQTIAKGLDLPRLATVGVVQADAGLSLPDYSSEERTFHLLTQVIGRVGRGHLDAAEVFIQTYQPDHPVIHAAINNDYDKFYHHILAERKSGHFPPFYYIARLSITYKTETSAIKYAKAYYSLLKSSFKNKLIISAPTPSFHERTTLGYTWQLVIRAASRAILTEAIKSLPKNPKLHLTIDPPSLLS